MNTRKCFAVSAGLLLLIAASPAWAAASTDAVRVDIVTAKGAPKLEQLAASELAEVVKKVFEADAIVSKKIPAGGEHVILIGSPATNPAIAQAIGKSWPKLSDQGILLKSVTSGGKKVLIVGGGSPVATLWAAYELGHRSGVRYLLQGDFYPPARRKFELPALDVAQEPTTRLRAWRAMDDSLSGFQSWGLADQQRIIKQLAKLKFNRVVLALGSSQTSVRFEFRGLKDGPLQLYHGEHFPINRDTVGRMAFQGASEFTNPDLAGKKSDEELAAATRALVNGIIDSAHDWGMSAGIELNSSVYVSSKAPDFVAKLKETAKSKEGAVARLKACLAAYPATDAVYMSAEPTTAPIAAAVFKEGRLLERAGKPPRELNFIIGDGLHITPQAGAKPSGESPAAAQSIVLKLTHESLGVLWQVHTRRLHKILSGLKKEDRGGYLATAELAGDADPTLHYLSRAAYDPATTPESACQDLYGAICGKSDAAARLLESFDSIEKANDVIDDKLPQLGLPRAGMLQAAQQGKVSAAAVADALKEYSHADDEVYRAHDSCQAAGRRYLFYYAKRGEFAIYYVSCIDALEKAAAAARDGKADARDEQLQTATESMYNAIECMREINRDQSDRAVIAVLNKYAYRPLVSASGEGGGAEASK